MPFSIPVSKENLALGIDVILRVPSLFALDFLYKTDPNSDIVHEYFGNGEEWTEVELIVNLLYLTGKLS